MWYEGLLQLSAWQIVVVTLVLTQITIVSVTVYLHRHSAHNSVDLHPALAHFFRFWLWLTTGMVTKEWTAIHRKHHAKCETAEDPHSPVQKGFNTVMWRGAELYREAATPETLERYGQRCPEDWLEHNVYMKNWLGISIMAVIDLLLFGVLGITVWAVQMIWIPFFAAGVINGIGHHWGYRNFECTDNARNLVPWGLIIGGEELHNNHHTYPNSPKLSVKKWEFDIGWFWIKLFEFFRLAKPKRVGPIAHQVPGKAMLDLDTLMAIANNRFQVMVQYRKRVLQPILKEQQKAQNCKSESSMLKRVKKLMYREESLIAPGEKEQLEAVLEKHEMLKVIYEKSKELQALWRRQPGIRYQDKLHELIEWCHQAEQSGVKSLEEFSAWLKTFSLAPAPAMARA
ncbi:DesA family fatty acid desaturase [Hahella ganghwensis]|uniref:DesA family fatty acid desaturase n=1 Tax=Hahella ganghwensis TaxID=286420 RepID=UPI0003636AF9|nr:fatty acid desaturase [Hahella ganghwensis]